MSKKLPAAVVARVTHACVAGRGSVHSFGAMDDSNRRAVREIFEACRSLSISTGRPFSPDGHLVGSLGEVLAAELLDLTLMPPSNNGYDAVDRDGTKVEIKTTTRRSVGLSTSGTRAERLVVVMLDRDGNASIVYDGECDVAWAAAGKPQKNGQRAISLTRLGQLPPMSSAESQEPDNG